MEFKRKEQFVLPEQKFSRENGISWKVDQNFQTEFPPWKMCVPFAGFYLFRALCLGPLWKKIVEMEWVHPTENFHLGFDAYHLLQLSDQLIFPSKW